jgi:hypothetical protein
MMYPLMSKGFPSQLAKALGVAPVFFTVIPKLIMHQLMFHNPGQQCLCVAAIAPAGIYRPRPVQTAY